MYTPVLRVARPTDNIDALMHFYCDGLGFEKLSSFNDHNGFNGVMLGRSQAPYHFEFTHQIGHIVGKAPTQDHLLVFYVPDAASWKATLQRMQHCGFPPVASYNPYWNEKGCCFEDPDGYRIVLQQAEWAL
ncbi:VOC family protein [Hymenobacter sp. NBH84]|uniref:VOC family protein n=1 Tax=Hymenobacter sp. NBH84 TaxID=2596915 RepID=UPI00162AE854|nr:VOC family protein [Hymenobacter sp. NBH84]QNE41601.1 VOC family protein [Hymenobacter sp. NBH84]